MKLRGAKHVGVESRKYSGVYWPQFLTLVRLGMLTDSGERPGGGQSSAVSETLGVTRRLHRRTPLEYGPLLRNLARCSSA